MGHACNPPTQGTTLSVTPTHLSMKMAVATTTHHTYYTNGVMEETVGHRPTGANEAQFPVRANVTRRHADAYAAPITVVVVKATKMIITRQSTRA